MDGKNFGKLQQGDGDDYNDNDDDDGNNDGLIITILERFLKIPCRKKKK